MVKIACFSFNPLNENTYILYEPAGECVFIDPGNYDENEFQAIAGFVTEKSLTPSMIINTHCHVDHVLGVAGLKEKYGIPFYIHADEQPMLSSVRLYAPVYGFAGFTEPVPDGFLSESQEVRISGSSWKVLLIPGHSPGHIALYEKNLAKCIAGDILFRDSIGRADLPGGNMETLVSGIREKLFSLPDETEVFPGHGPSTTIGYEKRNNPYCRPVGPE